MYKAAYLARYKKALSHIVLHEFLAILGGDAALGQPGMWFSWASPFDIIRAFKKVGIAGNVFYPETSSTGPSSLTSPAPWPWPRRGRARPPPRLSRS